VPYKFLDKIEVDEMGIMWTEKVPVVQQILELFEMF
jgi:hypothetical protein